MQAYEEPVSGAVTGIDLVFAETIGSAGFADKVPLHLCVGHRRADLVEDVGLNAENAVPLGDFERLDVHPARVLDAREGRISVCRDAALLLAEFCWVGVAEQLCRTPAEETDVVLCAHVQNVGHGVDVDVVVVAHSIEKAIGAVNEARLRKESESHSRRNKQCLQEVLHGDLVIGDVNPGRLAAGLRDILDGPGGCTC